MIGGILLKKLFVISLIVLFFGLTTVEALEPTTEVHVIKYGADGSVSKENTVTYQWMEANLPIYGDGVTHYYHQGPVFEGDKWDLNETANFKDKGAVKGTNVKDLCDLVGGMSPGDEVMIHSPDGYHVEFDYGNIYEPEERQGPLVLCWYCGEDTDVGERQGEGYPPDYFVGMRLVFFSDTSINPEGKYVFGNSDMNETLPDKCIHFYELYPSTNGLSIKWVDELRIYGGGYSGDAGGPAKTMPEVEQAQTDNVTPGFSAIVAVFALMISLLLLRRM